MSESATVSPDRVTIRQSVRGLVSGARSRAVRWATDPRILILLVAVVGYTAYWARLTTARYFALRADVFDLGVYFQSSWQVLHGPFTAITVWQTFATEGITYLVFPLVLPGSYPFLLAAQSFMLGACAFPIYGIASRLLRDRTAALTVSLGYLVFFPVGGLNWFDVHTEAFFLPLFLVGYYAHLAGHPRVAYVLLGLSGLTRFPFAVYPALFGAVRLAERQWRWLPLGPDPSPRYPARYDAYLLVASIAVLAVSALYFLVDQNSVSRFLHAAGPPSPPNLDARIIALILLGIPFLALPALSPRWGVFLLPAAALILATPASYYGFPFLFYTQYTATVIPFLYLGFLDAITRVFPTPTGPATATASRAVTFLRRRRRQSVFISVAITVVLALAFQPWGPWNTQVSDGYNLPYYTGQNQTLFDTLTHELSLIPADAGNVLVQDDMPQAFPRPLGNNGTILIPGETMAYNFTYYYHNAWAPAHIDYVLLDPYSDTFLHQGPYPYNISMASAARLLYNSGNFGLLAEANGILLFARGYTGELRYYVPQNLSLPASELSHTGAGSTTAQGTIVASNVTNGTTVWFGPYLFLQPGHYNITYQLQTSNASAANHLQLDLLVGPSDATLASNTLTGAAFPTTNAWTNVTESVYLDSVYPWVNLPANGVVWAGSLTLAHIWIREVASASVIHVVGTTPEDNAVYQLAGLVPSASTLLVQPDLVEFVPNRSVVVSTSFLPGTPVWPSYILGDPFRSGFDAVGASNTASLDSLAGTALSSRGYHVLGMLSGVFLLTSNATAKLALYRGLNATYTGSDLFVTKSEYAVAGHIVATNATSQGTVWFGPYEFLQPGRYQVTYLMRVSNNSPTNFLKLDVLAGSPPVELNSSRLDGSAFAADGIWTNITRTFQCVSFLELSNFPANDVDWSGTVELASITLVQLAPS